MHLVQRAIVKFGGLALRAGAFFCLILGSLHTFAQAPAGIPRDLARLRAQQLKDVRYQLSYTITPRADFVSGHEELRFVQNADDRGILPEWLDFREGEISSLTVNGKTASTEIQNGHVELPAKLLKLGENVVAIDFKAPVAPAGKAITRFEDKDDGSEYIYTLFVPMDAEMAFPCFDQPDLKARFKLTVTTPADWTVISNTARNHETRDDNAGGCGASIGLNLPKPSQSAHIYSPSQQGRSRKFMIRRGCRDFMCANLNCRKLKRRPPRYSRSRLTASSICLTILLNRFPSLNTTW